MGQLVRLWKLGQKFWHPNRELIPDAVYKSKRFSPLLLELQFVVKKEDGYYVKGSKTRFAWIVQKADAGKLGGRPPQKAKTEGKQGSEKTGGITGSKPKAKPAANRDDNREQTETESGSKPADNPPFSLLSPPNSQDLGRTGNEEQDKDVTGHPNGGHVTLQKPTEKVSSLVWEAYRAAYAKRYSTEPVRNGTVNGQIANLVKRLGREAAEVVAFYVAHNGQFYVRQMHPIGLCLKDAESLRTQWATGRVMTGAEARSAEGLDFHRQQMARITEGK